LILSKHPKIRTSIPCVFAALMGIALITPAATVAQELPSAAAAPSTAPAPSDFKGSVPAGKVSAEPLQLSLDDAIRRGLRYNLGMILSGTQTAAARAQRLSELQALLPSLDFKATEAELQTDLPAQGLRIPGIPTIIGPFGYSDLRASLTWSLVDLNGLHNYLAAKHNFAAAQMSAEDAQNLVILTVGNAYLLVLADQAQVDSVRAQVATSRISLNQAVANHTAGTAPRLDELRARVDYQTIEQRLIVAQDALAKDKLALARVIGLPLEQAINLVDEVPYSPLDDLNAQALIQQAETNRKDLSALVEQTAAAEEQRKAATAARFPTLKFNGDYGDIGVNVKHSHGTGDASGTLSVPLFKEFGLRGQAQVAQAQLDTQRARLSDLKAQVDADVRDALLDIASAQRQVEVARSSRDLANQALADAQDRYKSGVSDNLAVSQAQQSVAQADQQYVSSLYRDNVAKLTLARALGEAENYKNYLGGK
jgi:outer membrane protein TolC